METQKKRRGDRKDGRLLRELDSLHYITGIIYPNRCDNEAYVSLRIDLTAMNAYLAETYFAAPCSNPLVRPIWAEAPIFP